MKSLNQQYRELVANILENGTEATTRGLNYKYVFGAELTFDASKGTFPLIDSHKVYWKVALGEILWDLHGEGKLENIPYKGLRDVWSNFAVDGVVPNSYYYNWRKAFGRDQIVDLIDGLSNNPTSRSHILQSYNPAAANGMPQCHPMVIYSSDGEYLDCLVVGRSNDVAGYGTSIDLIRYWFLLTYFAQNANLIPRIMKFTISNAHIYESSYIDAAFIAQAPLLPECTAHYFFDADGKVQGNLRTAYNKPYIQAAYKLTSNVEIGDTDCYGI